MLQALGGRVSRRAVVTAVLEDVFQAMRPNVIGASTERLRAELAMVEGGDRATD